MYATWARARISPNAPKVKVKEDIVDSGIAELKRRSVASEISQLECEYAR